MASSPPSPAAVRAPRSRRARLRQVAGLALEVLALTAFALTQPVFDLLGRNPTFLVAHNLSGASVVWFALALLLVPPLVLVALEAAVALMAPRALAPVHSVLTGLLVGFTVTAPLARSVDSPALWVVVFAGVAVGSGLLRARVAVTASVLRTASLAALLFLGLFLLSGGVADLISPSDAGAVAPPSGSDVSVVWLVLDEMPLGIILDADGELDRARFPGFARLADVSTWYPSATSSSPRTNVSVLSALTGLHPENNSVLPVGSRYPVNAFSLLGGGHDLDVHESVTQICPVSLCPDTRAPVDQSLLWSDTWTVFVRAITPDSVADRLVPEINDRWAGFGDSGVDEVETGDGSSPMPPANPGEVDSMDELFDRIVDETNADQRARFDAFVRAVTSPPGDRPTFDYLHALVPHIPYRYLPGGLAYDRVRTYGALDGTRWVDDEGPIDHMMQRMLLQAQYADEQVGRLVDGLEAEGRLDDTMIVVMSDHGVSMTPGTKRREYEDSTVDDMLPIPFFIHYPGEGGAVDDRMAQPVDLLPTVVDVVGVEVPEGHRFDGNSLLGPRQEGTELTTPSGVVDVARRPDVMAGRVMALKESLFAPDADFYRPRRFGDLVGEPVPDAPEPSDGLVAVIDAPDRWLDVETASTVVPAHVTGRLEGRDEPVDLAVALNGVVAGVGRTYETEGRWQVSVMTDPRYLHDGENTLSVWETSEDGLRAVELLG